MSPFELKMKLDLADDKARFVKEHSMSSVMNVIVTDDGHTHFFDDDGNDITEHAISIEDYTFYNYKSLTSIVIPDSVTSIGKWAFSQCMSLTNIFISDSVAHIRYCAFSHCISLKSIVIPDYVKSIGDSTFFNCISLTSISIPDSVT